MLYVNLVVLTVCRLNPESEFNIKSNQINLFKLGEEWLPDLPSQRLMYQTCEHSGSNWNLEVLVFRRGENRSTRRGTSRRREEKRTNNKLDPRDNAECGNRTPGHIGRAQVLSPPHHPCSLYPFYTKPLILEFDCCSQSLPYFHRYEYRGI